MALPVRDPDLPPSLDDIEAMARAAFDDLPDQFRALTGDIVFHVMDFPDDDVVTEMELGSPFELMGLYAGVPVGHEIGLQAPQDVGRIFLYRRPILDYWCEAEEPLSGVVRHVLIHEIGHHFGLSDEDMEAIEEG